MARVHLVASNNYSGVKRWCSYITQGRRFSEMRRTLGRGGKASRTKRKRVLRKKTPTRSSHLWPQQSHSIQQNSSQLYFVFFSFSFPSPSQALHSSRSTLPARRPRASQRSPRSQVVAAGLFIRYASLGGFILYRKTDSTVHLLILALVTSPFSILNWLKRYI